MSDVPLYLLEADWDGLTAAADDDDFTPEKAAEVVANVFNLGRTRLDALTKALPQRRDGKFVIPHCYVGYNHSFEDEANWNIMTERYPWAGIDSDGECLGYKLGDEAGDLERYLAKVPQDDWDSFMEDIATIRSDYELDSDETQVLVRKAEEEWVKDDGLKELVQKLQAKAPDSFTAFVLTYLTPRHFWELCQEKEKWPETQDGDSVWLDVDELIDNDTLQWALDQFNNLLGFRRKWQRVKRAFYVEHDIHSLVDGMVRKNMTGNPHGAAAYAALDEDGIYRFFLRLTPDSAYHDPGHRPRWMLQLVDYGQPKKWMCIVPPGKDNHTAFNWKSDLGQALDDMTQQPEAMALLQQSAHHEPLEHPELPLGEALDDFDDEASLEPYIKSTGSLRSAPVYVDDQIEIVEPRDQSTWETLMGAPEGWLTGKWFGTWAYARHYVVLDRQTHRPLGAFEEVDGRFDAVGGQKAIRELLKDPVYGKSVRRGFLNIVRQWWKQGAQEGNEEELGKLVPHLLTFGGPTEVKRRLGKDYAHLTDTYGMGVGIALVQSKQYRRAAPYLGLQPNECTAKGAWVYYSDYSDLASLFRYSESADEALSDECHDWFDYLWERSNRPDVKDVIPWLDEDAIKHVRELLVGREVWFPDAGEDQEGAYVLLTPSVLSQYTDDELMDWVAEPNDEDERQGVFDDIREAIQLGGCDMLASAGRDQVCENHRRLVRSQLDVIEAKYVDHPTKKGHDRLAFLVPWSTIIEAYTRMVEEHGVDYSTSLSDLLKEANNKAIDNDRMDNSASWPNAKEFGAGDYKEIASERLMQLEPEGMPPYKPDPRQPELPLGESEDDLPGEEDLTGWLEKPFEGVEQALLPTIQRLAERSGYVANDIRVTFKTVKDGGLIMVEFEASQPVKHLPHWSGFLSRLNGPVTHAMAQVGGIVFDTGFLAQAATKSHPVFIWYFRKAQPQ